MTKLYSKVAISIRLNNNNKALKEQKMFAMSALLAKYKSLNFIKNL